MMHPRSELQLILIKLAHIEQRLASIETKLDTKQSIMAWCVDHFDCGGYSRHLRQPADEV